MSGGAEKTWYDPERPDSGVSGPVPRQWTAPGSHPPAPPPPPSGPPFSGPPFSSAPRSGPPFSAAPLGGGLPGPHPPPAPGLPYPGPGHYAGPAPYPGPASVSGPPPGPGPAGYPAVPPGPARPRRRFPWGRVVTLVLIVLLIGVAGAQGYALRRTNQRLDTAYSQVDEVRRADQQRADTLQARVAELEQALGRAFNPEAIATAALPSVFRVRAGPATGTAFAVGRNTSNGGTNLFTNYHVVEDVWEGGRREVFLERRDQRFSARIVSVDPDQDVAHLQTTGKFTGLAVARRAVKAGQQIVVVGSPLGLEDSVTSGVVSAASRRLDGAGGPFIQFDAPINPGNSGGPVINSEKQVVGIASAKAPEAEGIGLAVPITTGCDKFKIC